MKVYEKLMNVQAELKAPKNQYNTFGKYSYRSCEDIQEAVKPLLKKYKLALKVYDEVVLIGDRYYVKATASVIDTEEGEAEYTTAYAREEETKKGMDASQITGSASSYARKYALNGLFCIDDTKDSDTTNTHDKESKSTAKPKAETKPNTDNLQGNKCCGCGKAVPDNVANFSTKKFGKALCFDCQKKGV